MEVRHQSSEATWRRRFLQNPRLILFMKNPTLLQINFLRLALVVIRSREKYFFGKTTHGIGVPPQLAESGEFDESSIGVALKD